MGLISLIIVISFWLAASILTKDILREYNKPALLTFISATSMQVYFVFLKLKDPLFEYLETDKVLIQVQVEIDEVETLDTKSVNITNVVDVITLTEVHTSDDIIFL